MTPYDINLLIHCYTSPEPLPFPDSPARKESLDGLCEADLIYYEGCDRWRTTPRGAVHIQQLCRLPFPTQVWVGADGKVIDT